MRRRISWNTYTARINETKDFLKYLWLKNQKHFWYPFQLGQCIKIYKKSYKKMNHFIMYYQWVPFRRWTNSEPASSGQTVTYQEDSGEEDDQDFANSRKHYISIK